MNSKTALTPAQGGTRKQQGMVDLLEVVCSLGLIYLILRPDSRHGPRYWDKVQEEARERERILERVLRDCETLRNPCLN